MIKDCDECEERILIDPNTFSEDGTISLGSTSVNNNADHIAYSISDGGSDWRIWKVMNIETGEILFANLKLSGQDYNLYYFDNKGSEGHYDKSGKSVRKALMKTPINGARLSSPFGLRKHPIDGFNKMHRGTDFAAPMGLSLIHI